MRTILHAIPLLMFASFLVMSGLTAIKFVSEARQAGGAGRPFMAREARRSAMISGFYMMCAIASLAILGLVPDTGANSQSVIVCFTLPSVPLGIIVAIGNYLRAKKAFDLAQRFSQRK
jgi:hypothetical protein